MKNNTSRWFFKPLRIGVTPSALLFALGHSIQFADKVPAFKLHGLDPDAVYEIECFGNNPQSGGYTASITEYQPMSGRGLMELGIRVELLGDYDARIFHLKKTKNE